MSPLFSSTAGFGLGEEGLSLAGSVVGLLDGLGSVVGVAVVLVGALVAAGGCVSAPAQLVLTVRDLVRTASPGV